MSMFFDSFRDLDRFANSLMDMRQGPRFMPIDLHREGDHFMLYADLPGVDPGSVDVNVDGQLLTIRAERTSRGEDDGKWLARERPSGSFLRQISIGEGIDAEHISANYSNGVLSVMMPVSERAKPRKIEVGSDTKRHQVTAK